MHKLWVFYLPVLCLFLTVGVVNAATIYVPNDQPTIQDAINAASDGDLIQILPGTYTEKVNVFKSVTINGKNGKFSTLVKAPSSGDYAFWVTAPNATIRGLTIRGGTAAAGVLINAQSVKIIGCIVERSGFGIVIGDGGSHSQVTGSDIRYSTESSGLCFEDLVEGTGVSVVSHFGGDITDVNISFNQIHENDEAGVWVFGYHDNTSYNGLTAESNILADNGAEDPIGSSNANRSGFLFQNVSLGSTITLKNNQIWTTSFPGGEVFIAGPNTPIINATGNLIYPTWVVTMQGQPKKLILP